MEYQGSPEPCIVLQMLQRLCGRVQEEVRALRLCPLEPVQDELLYARDLIKDAKNSRAVNTHNISQYKRSAIQAGMPGACLDSALQVLSPKHP